MKQLVDHIQKSIYNPAYYQELPARTPAFSWKYYSGFALLVALFLTVVLSLPIVPKVLDATHKFPDAFFAYYPDDLEIYVEKGVVSTNMPEPYVLPVPSAWKAQLGAEDNIESLLVIDTATPVSMDAWKEHKTLAWLGKNELAIMDDRGGVRIEPLPTDDEFTFTVNEALLRNIEAKLAPYYKIAAPAVVLVIFLGFILSLAVNFLYLIFGALLILLTGRLLKQRWSYGTSYRIGLHAITFPVLLETLLFAVDIPLMQYPFLFTALMLGVVVVNWKHAPHLGAPLAPSEKA